MNSKAQPSIIYKHGAQLTTDGDNKYWLCKYCHVSGRHDTALFASESTTSIIYHLRHHHKLAEFGYKVAGSDPFSISQGATKAASYLGSRRMVFNDLQFRSHFADWVIDLDLTFRQATHRRTNEIFALCLEDIDKVLPKSPSALSSWIHVSTDAWTSEEGTNYLAIVSHFLDAAYKLQTALLDLPVLKGPHTGENIAKVLAAVMGSYEIGQNVGFFMMDNASSNDTCIRELAKRYPVIKPQSRLRCVGHMLNLIVKALLFGVLVDGGIRWNSAYAMIQRAVKLRHAIDLFFLNYCYGGVGFADDHPDVVSTYYSHAIDAARIKLEEYFGLTDATPAYRCAVALHPANKFAYFELEWSHNKQWISEAKSVVQEVFAEYEDAYMEADAADHEEASSLALGEVVADKAGDDLVALDPLQEARKRRQMLAELAASVEDPLQWWICHAADYPVLSQMAFDLFTCPAMSAESVSGHLCLVTKVTQHECILEIMCKFSEPTGDIWPNLPQLQQNGTGPETGWTKAFIFPFVHDLDRFSGRQRNALLTLILSCIPPVLDMRAYLLNGPGKKQEFPSLFAWHGSSLGNWHSIIRTGLDFETIANGRSYGNGVYMSRHMAVSSGYAGIISKPDIDSASFAMSTCWHNSQLRPSRALSLCEIVNRPDQFVSKSPHYVVNQIQWIQCRYLYVEVQPTPKALKEPFPGRRNKVSEGYVPQDPMARLLGSHDELFEVPLAAIPVCRRAGLLTSAKVGSSEEPKKSEEADEATDDDVEGDDLELLNIPDDESEGGPQGFERPQMSAFSKSPDDGFPAANGAALDNGGSATDDRHGHKSASEFRPGALDHDSLPKLPPPSWAGSSPHALHALTREVKDLHKTQSQSPVHNLGWYINMDKMDNLFHWIVELHSFDAALPLAQDMARLGRASIVLEVRFGAGFPLSPPFVRVVRPRLLSFARGGGGHVTAGGAICSELLTNSGWSPALTMEKVLLQVRLGLCELDPPARLDDRESMRNADYGMAEAAAAYKRAATAHGWKVPVDLEQIAAMSWE
ncbi:poly(ADP-ribose) polymerase catalytic domain-containing protein [Hirsutella rhossiliensis]|uniref:Poly(ADP-ribose) polymerase catalytic domain-containing protein n=1 Tax=Hirsutella rhossiliensis TaxID=111463 RepID=A0A9P8MT52_9HYPO|nr:poly(ADP-ribose) polymerase catalytic domain-containing protein [Hirsutella rhossiliensis]KAH0960765.1 poly(ADP-ribose) polymerase catalytic domain-containing protein [Hirsutella rhossiliensis]